MVKPKIPIYVFLILLLLSGFTHAQVWISGGYNYGQYTYGLRDIQTVFYRYNHTTLNLIEPYKYSDIHKGLAFNMQFGDKTGGIEIGFTNKHNVFTSKSIENETEISRFYKCRLSTLDAGLVLFKNFFISPGTTADIGFYNEFKKVAPTASIDTASFNKTMKPGFFLGQTIFADIQLLGPRSPVNIIVRPYFQYQWLKVLPKFSEFGRIYYRVNNFGVSAQIRIRLGKD